MTCPFLLPFSSERGFLILNIFYFKTGEKRVVIGGVVSVIFFFMLLLTHFTLF